MKTMKRFAARICALFVVLTVSLTALVPAAFAATKAQLPDLPSSQCVVDDANILSSSTKTAIENLNAQLTQQCEGAQIGVLTVDYTGSLSTEDYAVQAANTWGLGSSSKNNGVLILLVMQSQQYADGDYYLATGDGFRNTTLEKQASAIAQTMEDSFAAGDYDAAVTTCANNVASTIADLYGVTLSGTTGTVSNGNTDGYNNGNDYYEAPAASYQSPFLTLLAVVIVVFALTSIFGGIRRGFGGGGFGPFFGFGLGYGLGSRRRRRPPYDDWGPRGPRGPRPPRGGGPRVLPVGAAASAEVPLAAAWAADAPAAVLAAGASTQAAARSMAAAVAAADKQQKMAVQPGCTAIFRSVEITWCRRYGRLRHPGRARCNRSRSGGRPWHPDRYRHRGVPCAGPQCLPEQRSGR